VSETVPGRGPAGVPAARHTLALLQALARQPGPVPAAALARDLGLPRSTTYHLLAELIAAGFVVHLPEERRYGLGVSAFEIGSAYARQEPLARLARPVLARLVDAVGHSAHLAVLHGREVLYVVEQRAPGRPPLVTDVGVRLPAQLTASGKAMLADLPGPHVRALFPTRARSSTGTGPGRAGSPTCAGCCRRSAGAATPPRTAG
jgi:DNA-binding IclR family transcriptional regulator